MQNRHRNDFRLAAIAAIIGMGIAGAGPAIAQGDAIAERQKNFKANGDAMKRMAEELIPFDDTDGIAGEAKKIADWAARMTEYFPPGSFGGKTEALPVIREKWDDFTAAAAANNKAALALMAAAEAGDMKAVRPALGKLGGTCKGCHQNFRQKK